MQSLRSIARFTLLAAALATAACSASSERDLAIETDVQDDAGKVIAVVETEHGNTVEFIAEGDGIVGIGERAPGGNRLIVGDLVDSGATPGEVFLALNPEGTDVPQALILAHRLAAAASGRPDATARGFELAANMAADPMRCSDASHWDSSWTQSYGEGSRASFADYFGAEALPASADSWVVFSTGESESRHLGACVAPDAQASLHFRVALDLFGQWTPIHTVELAADESYTYYSGHAAGEYRAQVRGGNQTAMGFGVGGAYR